MSLSPLPGLSRSGGLSPVGGLGAGALIGTFGGPEINGLGTDRSQAQAFSTAFIFNITSVSRPLTIDVVPGAGDVIELAASSDPAALTDSAHPSWVPFSESSFSRIEWLTTGPPVALRVFRTWGTTGGSTVRITAPARGTLPLDIAVNAQNVTAAFSLRRLRTLYTGPVCRVVALGTGTYNNGVYDVSPVGTAGITTATPVTYAGTGPTGATTVGQLLTLGGNNELWVSVLYEQMGLNANMAQTVAGNRLKITSSAGVLYTFGTSGRVSMMSPDFVRWMEASFPVAQFATSSLHTSHYVAECNSDGATSQICVGWNATVATNRMRSTFVPGSTTHQFDYGDTSGASNRSSQTSQDGATQLRTHITDSINLTHKRNDGFLAPVVALGALSGTNLLTIGQSGGTFRGGFAEFIVANAGRDNSQFSLKSDMLAAWGPMP